MSKPGIAQTPNLSTFLHTVKTDPVETSIERLISYVSQLTPTYTAVRPHS